MQLAFDLATETGDSDLVADLITAARTTGVFTHHGSVPKASFGPNRAVTDDLLSRGSLMPCSLTRAAMIRAPSTARAQPCRGSRPGRRHRWPGRQRKFWAPKA
jgi:hypothetical protein